MKEDLSTGNRNGVDQLPHIATPFAETTASTHDQGDISMGNNIINRKSSAITYPVSIKFDKLEAFLHEVEFALCTFENADFSMDDPVVFLKSLVENVECPAENLRWLADLLDKNLETFETEILGRDSYYDEAA